MLKTHSEKLVKCKCSCGIECYKQACSITSGHTSSCGECYQQGLKWWANKASPALPTTNTNGLKYSLLYLYDYFDGSFIEPLQGCDSLDHYIEFKCKLCESTFRSKPGWMWHAKIVSCGCATVAASKASHEIGRFVESLGYEAVYGKQEHKVGRYRLDVFVRHRNLAIELNGLRFHSTSHQKCLAYIAKHKHCVETGMQYLMIFEDEWQQKREVFERIIQNKLGGPRAATRLRPQKCEIRHISSKEANKFYEEYHYIGKCSAKIHLGVYCNNILAACMSIRKPSRQMSGDFEIARMARNEIVVHGVWSYLLRYLIKSGLVYGELVTYSDNRIFDGNVYREMGFKQVGQIRPDYYWTKNLRRHHKSALRKTKAEKATGLTESQLRMSQGYRKIYDLGKTKWSMLISSDSHLEGR